MLELPRITVPPRSASIPSTSPTRSLVTPSRSMKECLSVSTDMSGAVSDLSGLVLNLEIKIVRTLSPGAPAESVVFADEFLFTLEDVLRHIQQRLGLPAGPYQLRTRHGGVVRHLSSLVHQETYLLIDDYETGSCESIASLIYDETSQENGNEAVGPQEEFSDIDILHTLLTDEIEDVITDVIFETHAAARALLMQACMLPHAPARHTPLRFTHEFDRLIDAIHDVMVGLFICMYVCVSVSLDACMCVSFFPLFCSFFSQLSSHTHPQSEPHSSSDMDAIIRKRFAAAVAAAAAGHLGHWESEPRGFFALVMLLDQFPRRLHRGTAAAFRSETMLFEVVAGAVATKVYPLVSASHRVLVCLALSHVENLAAMRLCLTLWLELEPELAMDIVERVSDAIRRNRVTLESFGRFPDRNALLRRQSTPAEIAHLARGGVVDPATSNSSRLSVQGAPRRSTIVQTVARLSRRLSRRS
eukprot:m.68297 g.68297  ORF g.68297 m.68297 type:complete len:472 (-) comp12763_c0_seq1:154-1569(-)